MKRSFIISIVLVFVVTSAWAVGTVHNFTTGVMHDAADVYVSSPVVGNLQTEIDSLEVAVGTTLPTTYATKAYVNATDEAIITTASNISSNLYSHMGATSAHGIDTVEIAATKYNTYQHIYAAGTVHGTDTTDIMLKSAAQNINGLKTFTGSAPFAVSSNANIANLNASRLSDYAASDFGTTASVALKVPLAGGPMTGTLSNTAAITTAIGNIPFLLDPSNCSYFTRFQGNANDIVNGVYPTYNSSLLKYFQDQFISDSTTKGTVTATGFTLTQYEGDCGKYGYGAAFEEARTNVLTYTDDLTNGAWTKTNCTAALDRVLPDGRKLFKITVTADGNADLRQTITSAAVPYTMSAFIINTEVTNLDMIDNKGHVFYDNISATTLTRFSGTQTMSAESVVFLLPYATSATAGQKFYITSPQLEAGSFASSYSASTSAGASITRSATFAELPASVVNPSVGSVSFWMKPRFTSTSNDSTLFMWAVGANGMTTNEIIIEYQESSGNLIFLVYGSSGGAKTATYAVPAGFYTGWSHIAFTWNGSAFNGYYNGVLVATIASAVALSTFDATAKHLIGKDCRDGTGYPNFVMSDLAVLKTTLTDEQIKQIYSGGFHVKSPMLSGEVPNYMAGSCAGLENSYVDVANRTATFQKAGNKVYFRGGIKTGASAAAAFTLPVGYRPSMTINLNALAIGAATNNYATIPTTGIMTPTYGAGTMTDFSLDGIQFEAAQ